MLKPNSYLQSSLSYPQNYILESTLGVDDEDPLMVTIQTIVFNQDGTGSLTDVVVLGGETNVSELTWYSNATTIFGTLEGQLDEIGYVLSEQNQQLELTFPEGDANIYVRLE